jgi:denticleless
VFVCIGYCSLLNPPQILDSLLGTIDAHNNGIFDIEWNAADTHLATVSGDCSVRISCMTSSQTLYSLRGHTGTPKTVAWNPSHPDLLASGGRDGCICIWDLRMSGSSDDGGMSTVEPVLTVQDAHEDYILTGGRSRGKSRMLACRSVTGLVYNDMNPCELISSGSADG